MVNTRTSPAGIHPETPSTGAEAPAPVQVPPSTNGGLSQQGQQQVLLGQTPTNNNNNNSGTNATSVDTHMGVEKALLKQINTATEEDYVAALSRQASVEGSKAEKAKEFIVQQYSAYDLRIFGFMLDDGSNTIRYGFALCQFPEGDPDIGDATILFVGDRDPFTNDNPPMYKLPTDNGYKWVSVKSTWNPEDLVQHYSSPDNEGKFRKASGTNMHVPRLIDLPFEAGLIVVRNACTPYQLVTELIRLEQDPNCKIQSSNTSFIKMWCEAAMVEGAKNKSKLGITISPIASQNRAFLKFKGLRAASQLGDPSKAQPSSSSDLTPRRKAMQEELDQVKELLVANAKLVASMAKQASEDKLENDSNKKQPSTSSNQLSETGTFEGALLAAVKGFSGTAEYTLLQLVVWTTVVSKKKLNDKRDVIHEAVEKWGLANGYTVSDDFRLDKSFITDVSNGDMAVGEARATAQNVNRGFSLHATLTVSFELRATLDAQEQAEDKTEHTRTYEEKLKLMEIVQRSPPESIEELTLNTNTYTGMLHSFFGSGCPLYIEFLAICAVLNGKVVKQAKRMYDHLKVKQYHFAMCNAIAEFFTQRVRESAFKSGNIAWPSVAFSEILIPFIKDGRHYENLCFPPEWRARRGGYNPPVAPQQYQAPPPPPSAALPPPPPPPRPEVRNPFVDRTNNPDIHPLLRQEWDVVKRKCGGCLPSLRCIREKSGRGVSNSKSLPTMPEFTRDGGSTLCYTWILGGCRGGHMCGLDHPRSVELTEDFCRRFNDKTKSARSWIVAHSAEAMSYGKRKRE